MNITTYMTGGMALIIAVLWGWWTIDKHQDTAKIEAATAIADVAIQQRATAIAANENNQAELAGVKADLAKQEAARIKAEAATHERDVALWKAKQRINDAPKTDDGPVARVLRDTVDSLRVVPGSNPPADSDHPTPSGAATDSDKPVVPTPPAPPTS